MSRARKAQSNRGRGSCVVGLQGTAAFLFGHAAGFLIRIKTKRTRDSKLRKSCLRGLPLEESSGHRCGLTRAVRDCSVPMCTYTLDLKPPTAHTENISTVYLCISLNCRGCCCTNLSRSPVSSPRLFLMLIKDRFCFDFIALYRFVCRLLTSDCDCMVPSRSYKPNFSVMKFNFRRSPASCRGTLHISRRNSSHQPAQ